MIVVIPIVDHNDNTQTTNKYTHTTNNTNTV